jgi:hypothetical protein
MSESPRTDAEWARLQESGGPFHRYDTIMHLAVGMAKFAKQIEHEFASQSKQVDAVAQWIERNHPDGLIDSEPLEYQLEKIRERDLVFLDSVKGELAETQELLTQMSAEREHNGRMASEYRQQRKSLAEALESVLEEIGDAYLACEVEVREALAAVKGATP